MPTEDVLRASAEGICRRHAERALTGDLRISIEAAETEWDPVRMRVVFDQQMTIWRRYGAFDVTMDSAGRIVGFVDHDKYERCDVGDLSRDDVLAIVRTEEIVPPDATLVDLKAQRPRPGVRIYRATFKLRFAAVRYDLLEVDLNPTRRAIIAVRPRSSAR